MKSGVALRVVRDRNASPTRSPGPVRRSGPHLLLALTTSGHRRFLAIRCHPLPWNTRRWRPLEIGELLLRPAILSPVRSRFHGTGRAGEVAVTGPASTRVGKLG